MDRQTGNKFCILSVSRYVTGPIYNLHHRKITAITMYRLEHESMERWQGGRPLALTMNEDGKRQSLSAAAKGERFQLRAEGTESETNPMIGQARLFGRRNFAPIGHAQYDRQSQVHIIAQCQRHERAKMAPALQSTTVRFAGQPNQTRWIDRHDTHVFVTFTGMNKLQVTY